MATPVIVAADLATHGVRKLRRARPRAARGAPSDPDQILRAGTDSRPRPSSCCGAAATRQSSPASLASPASACTCCSRPGRPAPMLNAPCCCANGLTFDGKAATSHDRFRASQLVIHKMTSLRRKRTDRVRLLIFQSVVGLFLACARSQMRGLADDLIGLLA